MRAQRGRWQRPRQRHRPAREWAAPALPGPAGGLRGPVAAPRAAPEPRSTALRALATLPARSTRPPTGAHRATTTTRVGHRPSRRGPRGHRRCPSTRRPPRPAPREAQSQRVRGRWRGHGERPQRRGRPRPPRGQGPRPTDAEAREGAPRRRPGTWRAGASLRKDTARSTDSAGHAAGGGGGLGGLPERRPRARARAPRRRPCARATRPRASARSTPQRRGLPQAQRCPAGGGGREVNPKNGPATADAESSDATSLRDKAGQCSRRETSIRQRAAG